MKKRTAVIAALVSLMPMGQSLVIGTGAVLTSAAVLLFLPTNVDAQSDRKLYEAAYTKFKNKEYYEAITLYSKIIYYNSKDYHALFMRGTSKFLIDDNYGALIDMDKAIRFSPSKNKFYFDNRGLIHWSLNNKNAACEDFKQAALLGHEKGLIRFQERCNNK